MAASVWDTERPATDTRHYLHLATTNAIADSATRQGDDMDQELFARFKKCAV